MGSCHLEELLGNSYYEVCFLHFSLFTFFHPLRKTTTPNGVEKIIDSTTATITPTGTDNPARSKNLLMQSYKPSQPGRGPPRVEKAPSLPPHHRQLSTRQVRNPRGVTPRHQSHQKRGKREPSLSCRGRRGHLYQHRLG
jgi:hypothetical protein